MRENNIVNAMSARILWLASLLVLLGLVIAPASAKTVTINSVVEYNRTNPQFADGDTVNFTGDGQIKITSGQPVNISGCTFNLGSNWRGFRVEGGTLNLTNCTFQNAKNGAINAVSENGNPTITINGCTFKNNRADVGGAIKIENGTLVITGKTLFEGNVSADVKLTDGKGGGAINARNTNITIEDGTFRKNTAVNYGGAILQNGGSLTLGKYNNAPDAIYNAADDSGKVIFDQNKVTNTGKTSWGTQMMTRGGAVAVDVDCNGNDQCTGKINDLTLTVNNAKFTGNTSTFQAGALSLGYSGLGDKVADHSKPMNEIIHVHAVIHLAEFTNNKVTNNDNYNVAGGAIVINSDAELLMEDATFVNNKASNAGGAIASCMWGSNNVNIPAGAAIFGNTAENPLTKDTVPDDKGKNAKKMDIYVMSYDDEVHPSSIQDEMYTGGSHEWSILTKGAEYRHKDCPNEQCQGALYGFNGDPSSMDKTNHKVLFEGNEAIAVMNDNYNQYQKGNGGALGNNGMLTIRTTQRLNIEKTWADKNNEKNYRPAVEEYLSTWLKLTRSGAQKQDFSLGSRDNIKKSYCESKTDAAAADVCYYVTDDTTAQKAEPSLVIRVADDKSGKWNITFFGLMAMELDSNNDWTDVEWDIREVMPESLKKTKLDGQEYYPYHITQSVKDDVYYFNNELNFVTISGEKTWKFENEADKSKMPQSISVHLHRNGKSLSQFPTAVKTVTDAENWSWTFEDLPKYDAEGNENDYYVHETYIPHFVDEIDHKAHSTISNITNTYKENKTRLYVFKTWDDGENRDNKRKPLTFALYQNLDNSGKKYVTSKELDINDTQIEFTDLPLYDGNANPKKLIQYEIVEETQINGYTQKCEPVKVPFADEEFDETEILVRYECTNTYQPQTVTLSVTKTWDDDSNKYNTRPENDAEMLDFLESIHLYAGNERHELTVSKNERQDNSYIGTDAGGSTYMIEVTRNDDENLWTVTCSGLPLNGLDHQPIDWRLKEGKGGGYTPLDVPADGLKGVYDENTQTYNYEVTNSLNEMAVTIIKKWDDNHNADGDRPDEETFLKGLKLYNNGVFYEHGGFVKKAEHQWGINAHPNVLVTIENGDTDEWKIIVDHLPKRQNDNWSADEILRGFEWNQESIDPKTRTFTFSNKPVEKIELNVRKNWVNEVDSNQNYPSVTVYLQENGVDVEGKAPIVLSAPDWTGKFEKLYKVDEYGQEIEYSVREETVPGYTFNGISKEADGTIVVTNTKTPPERPFKPFFPIEELPKTGFSALRPTALAAQPHKLSYSPSGLTLMIPSLDVSTAIVTVPYTDGNYPVEWLGNQAGLLEGSAVPGEGFTVLTGHNHLNTMEAGPFAFLSSLSKGDMVFVVDEAGTLLSFKVNASVKIAADDSTALERLATAAEGTLTLLTCEDETPEGTYANRRVITAVPWEIVE